MNTATRGIRNAFRNVIRTSSIVVILGLSIGLALAMLVANMAVSQKITSVKESTGNTVTVTPAGARGFEGGGDPLTSTEAAKLTAINHVASSVQSMQDRMTTDSTNLQSAVEAGALGQRNANRSGVGFQMPPSGEMGGTRREGESSSSDGQSVTRTFTPPVTAIGTTDAEASASADGGTFKLTSGKVFDKSSSENVAIIGSTLATKNNLKVGSTFTAYNTTITVAGIFDSGNTFSNNRVIFPLAALQTLSSQKDQVTSITLNVDSVDNIASVSTAAKSAIGDKGDVTDSESQVKQAVEPLQNIQTISLYSLVGAVVAGAVIILLTMVMIVRERRREIGVIKAIGGSNIAIMSQFVFEAVTLTILGAVVGIVIGITAGAPITNMLVSNSTSTTMEAGREGSRMMMRPGGIEGGRRALRQSFENLQTNVGWEIIAYGIGVAILIAIIGSALASFFIAKVRPAEVMRTE